MTRRTCDLSRERAEFLRALCRLGSVMSYKRVGRFLEGTVGLRKGVDYAEEASVAWDPAWWLMREAVHVRLLRPVILHSMKRRALNRYTVTVEY